jgi:gamma-glutamylputrescine oxidase
MAGNLIAHAIVDGDDTWRLFLPFELIWAGGLSGRVAAQVGYWWRRRRDQTKAQMARSRQAGDREPKPVRRRPVPAKKGTDRAASPPDMPPAAIELPAAMELPAVALPADPQLELPSRMEEPLVSAADQPAGGQRRSGLARKASRSNR